MKVLHPRCSDRLWLAAIGLLLLAAAGCTRSHYRRSADEEVYGLVDCAKDECNWPLADYTIEPKCESRMYDPFSADHPPMPPDDPTSHQLMHCVDCKKGWPCWHRDGDTSHVENPGWKACLPFDKDGWLALDRSAAMRTALLHSREYQFELEELYLSALDVTFQRFRLDAQFFGGNTTFFTADGPQRSTGRQSLLEVNNTLRMQKYTATGATIVTDVANSLVWQFAGPDEYRASTLLDFSLIQPLLRAGGRAVALENLTEAERTLLANIRQMEYFRRAYYTQIISGRTPGPGPIRGGFATNLAAPLPSTTTSGVLGLLGDQIRISNQLANVEGLQQSVDQIEAYCRASYIDQLQVDITRQALYNAQRGLLSLNTAYADRLDQYKITLGLPPDLKVRIQDPVLKRFDLMDPDATAAGIQNAIQPLLEGFRKSGLDEAGNRPVPDGDIRQAAAIVRDSAAYLVKVEGELRTLQQSLPARGEYLQNLQGEARELAPGWLDPRRIGKDALNQRYRKLKKAFVRLVDGTDLSAAELEAETGPDQDPLPEDAEADEELQLGLARPDPLRKTLNRLEEFAADPQGAAAKINRELQDEAVRTAERDARRKAERAAVERAQRAAADQVRETARQQGLEVEEMMRLVDEAVAKVDTKQVIAAAAADIDAAVKRVDAQRVRTGAQWSQQELFYGMLDRLSFLLFQLSLAEARARLELVSLVPVDMDPEEALETARENRLDWMNARAALVDQWRQIKIRANALRSDLNVVFNGDISTTDNNPLRFRGTTGRLRVGVQFDAPLTRLVERNAYREALIDYQRARRTYYTFEDRVNQGLRTTLRSMRQGQVDFELRRIGVHVAISQVDITRERLNAPPKAVVAAKPGETVAAGASSFGPTTARDLVSAYSGLLTAQNDLVSGWIDYESDRLSLDLDLGTMQLDAAGQWVDPGPIKRGKRTPPAPPELIPAPKGIPMLDLEEPTDPDA